MRRQAPIASAFTLVELLAVIAILVMLISLLIPTLTGARGLAERARCLENFRQLGQALQGFAAGHEGRGPGRAWVFKDANDPLKWIPYAAWIDYGKGGGTSLKGALEGEYFQTKPGATPMIASYLPYQPSDRVTRKKQLACPSARYSPANYGVFETICNKAIMQDPFNLDPCNPSVGPYQLEGQYGVRVVPPPQVPNRPGINWTVYTLGPRLAQFPNPADQFALWEGEDPGYDEPDFGHETTMNNAPALPPDYAVGDMGLTGKAWVGNGGVYAFRHFGLTGAFLFLDGHAEALNPRERIMDPVRFKYR
jgi:hypothetical protein